ncbi:MAG: type II toxin-antitoxin system PemK/MazF family toxin [bacterium]|nr:type II toxin-antitoxin system PemK/MazF family toxin [bacterium]
MLIKRGEIYSADLIEKDTKGAEIGKIRPVLVVQANSWNDILASTIIVPLSSRLPTYISPRSVVLRKDESSLDKESSVVFSQIRSIDKSRLQKKIGKLPAEKMKAVNKALSLTLGLESID